jgi:hypothetical protein
MVILMGNQTGLHRWQAYEMPLNMYQEHPEFCRFLEKTPLLNQIKVARDRPFVWEGEAALLVDGQPAKWSELKNRFEAVYSRRFDEPFIVDKATLQVYTYLDNGLGLQKHHPYLSGRKVISKLSPEEVEARLRNAYRFIRPGEEVLASEERELRNRQRVHLLQIVSSYSNKGDSNLYRAFINPQHPYLRLVNGQDHPALHMNAGDVYEVGYRAKNKITFPAFTAKGVTKGQFLPFVATQGIFRSPDAAEYTPTDAKVVTNIPVTAEEAEAFHKFTERYHREYIYLGKLIGFHIASQNCTTYVRKALQEIGIAVPTEISALEMLHKSLPSCFENLSEAFYRGKQLLKGQLKRSILFLPAHAQNALSMSARAISFFVKKLFEAIAAFPLACVRLILGDAVGMGGQAFTATGEPAGAIKPGLSSLQKWFSLSSYHFHMPAVLQEWQKAQPSTTVYQHPIRLTI